MVTKSVEFDWGSAFKVASILMIIALDFCQIVAYICALNLVYMDNIIIVISIILVIIGVLGSFLPVLPGPPLAFCGLILLKFSEQFVPSNKILLIYFIVGLVITILDYYIPILGTKIMGGSKKGKIGSIIGLIVGLFFAPYGIILGPFLGALIGEWINKTPSQKAFKAALGSFFGFIIATLMKIVYTIFILIEIVKLLISN